MLMLLLLHLPKRLCQQLFVDVHVHVSLTAMIFSFTQTNLPRCGGMESMFLSTILLRYQYPGADPPKWLAIPRCVFAPSSLLPPHCHPPLPIVHVTAPLPPCLHHADVDVEYAKRIPHTR